MRVRSPNYPAVSLPEAIEKVRAIYKEAHRRKLSRAEIAKLLGYGGLNGASITGISALTKYGLLEGRGDEIRVSDDAVTIMAEEVGSPDRTAAIRRIALNPELFAEFMEGTSQAPGENAVRIRLERKGFTAKAAQAAARAFRETMALVEQEGRDYNEQEEDEAQPVLHGGAPVQVQTPASPPTPILSASFPSPAPSIGAEGLPAVNFPLPRGNAIEIRLRQKVTAAEFDQLRQLFDLLRMSIVEE